MPANHTLVALLFFAAPSSYTSAQTQEPRGSTQSETLAVSLEALKERRDYAGLDKESVQAMARAAALHWPEEFAGFTYLRVEQFSTGGVSHWISIRSHRKTEIEFALVPGGRFQMGSATSVLGHRVDEARHWVTLDPFLIARTECSQGAWNRIAAFGADGESSAATDPLPKAGISPTTVEE